MSRKLEIDPDRLRKVIATADAEWNASSGFHEKIEAVLDERRELRNSRHAQRDFRVSAEAEAARGERLKELDRRMIGIQRAQAEASSRSSAARRLADRCIEAAAAAGIRIPEVTEALGRNASDFRVVGDRA